mmetsp:Transcript_5086/g.11266  ORF Transcript_5086/g.11266 Transcript_5086/m.11266 type:complete len:328 (+) Transcript_5086:660-1643(+)
MFVAILGTVVICKVVRVVATFHELRYVIPPLLSNSVCLSVMLPDTDTPQTLLHNIGTRDSMVKIIVGVGGTITSVVGAKIEAHVLSIKSLAITLHPIVNVHMRSEVRSIPQSLRHGLKLLLEILAHRIRGSSPQIILDAIIRFGKSPLHFHLHHVISLKFGLDLISIHFEHEEGGDGNISPTSIVSHDGFRRLAHILSIGRDTILIRTKTSVIRNHYPRCSRTLCIPDFLNKRAPTTIHHENVRTRPRFHFASIVFGTNGVSSACVDGGIAEIGGCVVYALGDGSTVGRDSEECFAVVVSFGTEESLRDMNLQPTRYIVRTVSVGYS